MSSCGAWWTAVPPGWFSRKAWPTSCSCRWKESLWFVMRTNCTTQSLRPREPGGILAEIE